MDSLKTLSGGVVDHGGRKFSLTMGDMAIIQDRIPIDKQFRPFIGLTDVIRFCGSPQGIPVALLQAAKKFDSNVTISILCESMSNVEQISLVGELINLFMGDDGIDTGSGAGEPRDPLAVKSETGS